MAYAGYGAKYTLKFSDVYQNTTDQYIATIYKKGYSGTVYEINGSGDPVTIETDRDGESSYRPIISTIATVNIQLRESDTFSIFDFVESDVDTMLLEIKLKQAGGSYDIKWQGYYINTTDFSLSEIYPINISLRFSDFSLLKSKRFYDFVTADSDKNVKFTTNEKVSLLEIMLKACNFSQITDKLYLEFNPGLTNVYKTPSSTVSLPLTQSSIFLQKNAFLQAIGRYETMYDVLSAICKQYLLVAYYKNNILYISSYYNLLNSTTRTYSAYQVTSFNLFNDTVTYTQLSDVSETDSVTALNSSDFKNIGRSQIVYLSAPKKNFVYKNTSSLNVNINNYNFNTPAFRSYTAETGPGGTTITTWNYSIANWYNSELIEYPYSYVQTGPPSTITTIPLMWPFYPYSPINTATPTQFDYATRFAPLADGFKFENYMQSTPLSVNSGDYVSISLSYRTDGRLKSAPNVALYRPQTRLAITLKATDKNGEQATFFYNKITSKFTYVGPDLTLTTPSVSDYLLEPTVITNFKNDSDRGVFNLKSRLDIPSTGEIRVRMYTPYSDYSFVLTDDAYAMYLEYLNMQTFKGHQDSNIPKTQEYTITYDNTISIDNNIENDAKVFNLDGTQYNLATLPLTQNPNRITPFLVSSYIGNHLIDTYNNPASGISYNYTDLNLNTISYTNLKNNLNSNGRYVLANNGLLSTRIQGNFKSNPNFTIAKKFSYQILDQPSKNYIMLDYSISLKNAAFDVTLYSINYTNDSGKTITSTTVLS